MTLNELKELFINSNREDWNQISCWGHGCAPSYKDKFIFNEVYNGDPNILTHDSFPNVASYKDNLSVTLAYGFRENDGGVIDHDWATQFPNPDPAKIYFLDFFYNNALVYRINYCTVDGGRCSLPLPSYNEDGGMYVETEYYNIMRAFENNFGTGDFDYHFGRIGFEIR